MLCNLQLLQHIFSFFSNFFSFFSFAMFSFSFLLQFLQYFKIRFSAAHLFLSFPFYFKIRFSVAKQQQQILLHCKFCRKYFPQKMSLENSTNKINCCKTATTNMTLFYCVISFVTNMTLILFEVNNK